MVGERVYLIPEMVHGQDRWWFNFFRKLSSELLNTSQRHSGDLGISGNLKAPSSYLDMLTTWVQADLMALHPWVPLAMAATAPQGPD